MLEGHLTITTIFRGPKMTTIDRFQGRRQCEGSVTQNSVLPNNGHPDRFWLPKWSPLPSAGLGLGLGIRLKARARDKARARAGAMARARAIASLGVANTLVDFSGGPWVEGWGFP